MPIHITPVDAEIALDADLSLAVTKSLRLLLETKHLYQSVTVGVEGILQQHIMPPGHNQRAFDRVKAAVKDWPWIASDVVPGAEALLESFAAGKPKRSIKWSLPDIKVYCGECQRIEPFNPLSSKNLAGDAYALSYRCQGCKGRPMNFLISKVGYKLRVCGRTPMEHVDVPKDIPKAVAHFYSGAKIAHQSGQTLAGLFMLRTLCEQWVRSFAPKESFADAALTAYMEQLPDDFKGRFPSLSAVYSDLSAAIHKADADVDLYDRAIALIDKHFKARTVYELPPPSLQIASTTPAS